MKTLTRKSKTKTKSKTKSKSKRHTPSAGEAIASGGYGCVFKPPIKCKNSLDSHEFGISKLMLKRHVRSEMAEIEKVKPYIDKIPNNKRYFLVDGITSCDPDQLTSSDKVHFDRKCNNLTSRGINKSNVNRKLNDLGMINIPYGGKDMDKYWKWWNQTLSQAEVDYWKLFASTNNSLIRLLKYGILPLNAQHFLHMDVKGGNVLRGGEDRSTDCNCRLIDWGLAETYNPSGTIPEGIEDKVIQFNIPFSIILFGTTMNKDIKAELVETNTKLQQLNKSSAGEKSILKVIAYNLLQKSIKEVGDGHIKYILKYLLPSIFENLIYDGSYITDGLSSAQESSVHTFGSGIICDYLADILFKFAKRGEKGEIIDIDIKKYFLDVFVHNVDVWGFLMCYLAIIENKHSSTGIKTPWSNQLTNGIARILIKYCFSTTYAGTKIPTNELINDLLSLNTLGGLESSLQLYKPITTVKKKPKSKLVIIDKTTRKQKTKKPNSLVERGKPFTWEGPGKKRCPKGSRRNREGKCIKK